MLSIESVKKIIALFTLLFSLQSAFATHYRAGEITYQKLAGNRYRITAITYTDPRQPANENAVSIVLTWGDGTSNTIPRTKMESLNTKIQRNTYVFDHEYKTTGVFTIGLEDPNRVDNIININNRDTKNIPFYVEATLRVDGSIGSNQSPILLNPPIDEGCKGFKFVHNPGAYDPDGDSLVYKLIPPKQGPGTPVINYSDPDATVSFVLNSRTGTLEWVNPITIGIYNIAIQIIEYRNGVAVGQVTRDMQIQINDCPNSPPILTPQPDACLKVGETITRTISAADPTPSQTVTIRGFGGPFVQTVGPAAISPDPGVGLQIASTQFIWTAMCRHIRYEPYQALFKATDNYSTPMSDINGFFIRILGPEPKNLTVAQVGNDAFKIDWDQDSCGLATRYDIYRRIDSSHWNPGTCEPGIPAYTGFVKIGSINAIANPNLTEFIDNDNGRGLSPMLRYCYRILSIFPSRDADGNVIGGHESESFASAEICDVIIRSKPILTRASVNVTNAANGSVLISWLRPDTLDTTVYLPPYRLIFSHSTNGNEAFTPFITLTYPSFSSIIDSSLVDTLLNTTQFQYTYKIDFYSDSAGTNRFIDNSPTASTVRASMYSSDNRNVVSWAANVPWINDTFIVYRRDTTSDPFDSIGFTTNYFYPDTGLINGKKYYYRVESLGKYSLLPFRIRNFSQEILGIPIDTIRPCPPALTITPPCTGFNNFKTLLSWVPDLSCSRDVVKYNIYFKAPDKTTYELLATVSNTVLEYTDEREVLKKSIAGCYVVAGVDSFNNESFFTNEECIDNCPQYEIPNVFTPDGDTKNDLLNPFPYRFIDHINLIIYNRWGQKVYSTSDINIDWDGRDQASGEALPDGTYFLICDVYEQFLAGLQKRVIRQTVQIIR